MLIRLYDWKFQIYLDRKCNQHHVEIYPNLLGRLDRSTKDRTLVPKIMAVLITSKLRSTIENYIPPQSQGSINARILMHTLAYSSKNSSVSVYRQFVVYRKPSYRYYLYNDFSKKFWPLRIVPLKRFSLTLWKILSKPFTKENFSKITAAGDVLPEFTMNWKNSILSLTGRGCYRHVPRSQVRQPWTPLIVKN